MAMAVLPSVPADWKHGESVVVASLPPLVKRTVEPAGRTFQLLAKRERERAQFGAPLVEDDDLPTEQTEEEDDASSFPGYEDEEPASLLKLDAGDWKNHDFYLILGLGKLRWRATDDDIKRAYRRKVLKHHPDKMASKSAGKGKVDDSFFKCVQKAYDILSDPVRRIHFDSVDPTFDESLPPARMTDKFYEVYGEAFEMNARFSTRTPVPKFGDDSTPSDEVRRFYDFWYNFESWRVFNWLDEEDTSGAESREEKRYYERMNEKMRAEHKKEDNARIRTLVDQAAALDPRVKRMKQEEKEKKMSEKEAKRAAEEAARLAAQREKEEAEAAARQAEAAAREQAEVDKKAREERKRLIKKERKTLRQHVKAFNCYLPGTVDESSLQMIEAVARLDKLCEELSYEELVAFNAALTSASDNGEEVYLTRIGELERLASQQAARAEAAERARAEEKAQQAQPWTDKDKALLIQAVKLFPGGTINRWTRITEHINEHSGAAPRAEKEVITEAKHILSLTGRVHEVALKVERKHDNVAQGDGPTQRVTIEDDDENADGQQASGASGSAPAPWTAAELEGLQTALRAVPATAENRWDKIAELVPTRSKKEIIAKFKEIAAMIKQKKAGGK